VAVEQIVSLRLFVEQATRPIDVTQRIEYRIATWVDQRLPGQRVMVPGSIAQWFNVFSDAPQLSGASYSTTPNWNQQYAMTSILTAASPPESAQAVEWLKAFGVQAAVATGPKSTEFWKGPSSTKFDGLMPVLWRQEDTTIYQVPQRSSSLAHVIPAGVDELPKYVAALDDPSLPLAEMHWDGFRRALIQATVHKGQVVSVQTGYHRGWHARANGHSAAIRRDALGFLIIEPQCEGTCQIELIYDGGWEYKLLRCLSLFTLLGLARLLLSKLRLRSKPRPRSEPRPSGSVRLT